MKLDFELSKVCWLESNVDFHPVTVCPNKDGAINLLPSQDPFRISQRDAMFVDAEHEGADVDRVIETLIQQSNNKKNSSW